MAHGKRRESRLHALHQAAVIWLMVGEDRLDVESFVKRGVLAVGGGKVDFGSRPDVIAKIEEIQKYGRLIV